MINAKEINAVVGNAGGITGSVDKPYMGLPGKDGASAYEIALENGFVGTEEEWLASLKGKDGIDGTNGKDGVDGKDGAQGPAGKDGVDGKDGDPGVYVGSTEPTDDSLVWINPEGGESTGYATTEYVDNAISAAITEVENGSY